MTETVDYNSLSDEEVLRRAIEDARTRPATCDFELSQMYGGIVAGNPKLEEVWEFETGPERAQAQLHFTGAGVTGHSMDAVALSEIVNGICGATLSVSTEKANELASNEPTIAKAQPLLISALKPGSVIVELETTRPSDDETNANEPPLDFEEPLFSVDDESLREVLLALASEGKATDIEHLPRAARRELHRAARTLKKYRLNADFSVRQRRKATMRASTQLIQLTELVNALELSQTETRNTQGIFELDGWKQSANIVYLKNDHNTSYSCTVTDNLLREIKILSRSTNFSGFIDCIIEITTTETPGKSLKTTRKIIQATTAPNPQAEALGEQISLNEIQPHLD